MPEAEPFAALGAGNGFPFCFSEGTFGNSRKLNVSNEDNVCPLTLSQAMNIWWNAYQFNYTANASRSGGGSLDGTVSQSAVECWSFEDDQTIEPKNRVCSIGVFVSQSAGEQKEVDNFSSIIPALNFLNLARFYDGSVADENNFLGFGFPGRGSGFPNTETNPGSMFSSVAENDRAGNTEARFELASFMTGTDFTDSRELRRYGTTTVSIGSENIEFAYYSEASGRDDPSLTLSADANGASASSSVSGNETASVTKPSLELYTYP